MKITVLGSCPEANTRKGIGPVGMFVQTDSGLNVVIDYGSGHESFQAPGGKRAQRAVTPTLLSELGIDRVDYIFLTHIHGDHSGLVPFLMNKFPMAELVTTVTTFALGNPVWSDSRIMARRHGFPGLVPFSSLFYEGMRRRSILVSQPSWVDLKNGARAYLNSNGHNRGSAYVMLEADGQRAVWSGDVSLYDMPTVKGMSAENVPTEVTNSDILFLESTHGNRVLQPREVVVRKMNAAIAQAISRGGKTLELALALERSQDLAIDQVLAGISPVYLEGVLAAHVWDVYLSEEGSWCSNDGQIDPSVAKKIICLLDKGPEVRDRMMNDENSYSIVASAGCLQGGYSVAWAKALLSDSRNLVCQCNYQFPGTPGRKLEKHGRGSFLELDGEEIQVHAQLMRVDATTHAGADQLVQIAKWFKPQNIAIYHGAWSSRRALQKRLARNGLGSFIPVNGDVIEL